MKNYEIKFRVKYNECDPMGVAHHGVYTLWLEDARTEQLRSAGFPYRDLEETGHYLVMTEMGVKYHVSARYDDMVRVVAEFLRPKQARVVRLEHTYRVLRGEVLLATARTTLACVGGDGRPREIPSGLVKAAGWEC